MLKYFKKFSDYINSFRKKSYNFKKIVTEYAKTSKTILEVGCNLRPINGKSKNYSLDGLDPDANINLDATKAVFSNFYNISIEDFKPQIKYDLIVLDMVFEHLKDNHETIAVLKKCLAVNGKIIMNIPSNMHPFSLLNQILPHDLKIAVLKLFRPWARVGVITGWQSYYHKCNIFSIKTLLKQNDLLISNSRFNYNASDYFAFFPPLFLLIVLYEELVRLLNLKLLCSHFMVVITNSSK